MEKPVKIIFRADGNSEIGLGHVIRSLALAAMLKDDFSCVFATRFVTDYIHDEVLKICKELIELDNTNQHFDQFLQLLDGDEIVVLDNYFYDTGYQQAIKNKGCKLVCIDDIHDKHFVADVVINHAGGIESKDYSIEPYTYLYLGTDYALLRPEFLTRHIVQGALSLFISMGGADKDNATLQTLKIVEAKQFPNTCHVIIGDAFHHQQALEKFVESTKLAIKIHKNLSAQAMADLMSECRYAVCPPSTVSYEYLSRRGGELYLKMIANNQKDVYNFYLKNHLAFDLSELFVEDHSRVSESLKAQRKHFDGRSKEQLLRLFKLLAKERSLTLRKAEVSDIDLYFKWANDPAARANALHPKTITYEEHVPWFKDKIKSADTLLLVLEENKCPVGQIRFDIEPIKKDAVISYFIAPAYRGKGLGLTILQLGMERLFEQKMNVSNLKAFVKITNIASCRAFERLGFYAHTQNVPQEGFIWYAKNRR